MGDFTPWLGLILYFILLDLTVDIKATFASRVAGKFTVLHTKNPVGRIVWIYFPYALIPAAVSLLQLDKALELWLHRPPITSLVESLGAALFFVVCVLAVTSLLVKIIMRFVPKTKKLNEPLELENFRLFKRQG